MNAHDALDRLRSGNRRFVRHVSLAVSSSERRERRASLVDGQAPSAIVLACADSRVPPELVFDAGLGEIFVVRVAGNVCSPATLASVEYAASVLGVPLVVVLGHTKCGAVQATVDAVTSGTRPRSASLVDLVERITPAVSSCVHRGVEAAELASEAIRANVEHTTEELERESPILAERIRNGKLMIVGAEYALDTGEVTFFDAEPASQASAA